MNIERPMPNAYESEVSFLGSVLIDPAVLDEDLPELSLDAFYKYENRLVYEAIVAMREQAISIDFITLVSHLERTGKLEQVGGEAYIVGLTTAVPTSVNAASYARQVASAHLRRRLVGIGSQVANLAYSDLCDDDLVTQVDTLCFGLNDQSGANGTLMTARQMADTHLAEVSARNGNWTPGLPTGLTALDELLGGIKEGKYMIVAGRPGMGKTALCDGMSLAQAKAGYRVGWIDLEMGHVGKFVRFVSNLSRLSTQVVEDMREDSPHYQRYLEAAGQFSELPIFVESLWSLSATLLRRKITHLVKAYGVDIVYIDHLQLMEDETKQTRERELANISRTIKGMTRSKELNNIPVVALVQLNRGVEARKDKRPQLHDLSGSGSFEQDADVVGMLYRDDYYNEYSERPNIVEINVAKNRGGKPGVAEAYWEAQSARFSNLTKVSYDLPRLDGASIR